MKEIKERGRARREKGSDRRRLPTRQSHVTAEACSSGQEGDQHVSCQNQHQVPLLVAEWTNNPNPTGQGVVHIKRSGR
jgi:hypothetical protein